MAYVIYTERYLGNGTVRREQYKCKDYSRSDGGVISFWNLKRDEQRLISIHKMDVILIQEIEDDKNSKEGEVVEIKCTT